MTQHRERCLATKRDGSPCRRYQAYPDGLCIQHHRQAVKSDICPYCAPDEPCALHTVSARADYRADEYAHERMTGQHADEYWPSDREIGRP